MLQHRTAIRLPRATNGPGRARSFILCTNASTHGPAQSMPDVCFTVDYEPDCPPYMTDTFRGVEEATRPLLALLHEEGVPSTFFSTGVVAERYPAAIEAIVAGGHELGCHGHTHRKFPDLA